MPKVSDGGLYFVNGYDIESPFYFKMYDAKYDNVNYKYNLLVGVGNEALTTFEGYKIGEIVYFDSATISYLYTLMQDAPTIEIGAYVQIHDSKGKYLYDSDMSYATCSIDNALPLITASVRDVNSKTIALTGDANVLVRYRSTAKATMTAEAQKGAAINEDFYIIRNGNNTGYGKEVEFENVEDNSFVFTAEDSRGSIGKKTLKPDMVDYVELTNNMAFERPDALGNVTIACSGNWYNGNFGAVQNTLTAQCRYSNSGWIDMKITQLDSNTYYASASFTIENFVQSQSYVFETRVADKLDTVTRNSDAVKSMPVFHWGENDFVFEVPVDINDDLYIKGNLRLKGDGNYGNRLNFGDGDYCYISEDADDAMTIHASEIDLDTNGLTIKGQDFIAPRYGTWTPTLLSSAISYYSSQYGWYSKVGQIVTVGFYIKANCNSGYQNSTISILGLPYTPMYSASGGGMCSGAYVSGGFTFQCYVADTGGKITTRVQSCNHTSQTNLSTSASGCWYPSGGGEVTLSGTITFITT